MRQSTNLRGVPQPQVWFRIVHIAPDGHHPALGDAISKQAAEVALGAKGAFQNCNSGAVTLQVAADRVVSALPEPRRSPKRPAEPRTPRIVELLRMAMEWQRQLDADEIESRADIARRAGITRARVTQILSLLRLSPEIQDWILALPPKAGRPATSERELRTICSIEDPVTQWRTLQRQLRKAD